jgi:hypothetical protein
MMMGAVMLLFTIPEAIWMKRSVSITANDDQCKIADYFGLLTSVVK